MTAQKEISDDQITEALRQNAGIPWLAAQALKISRAEIGARIASSGKLRRIVNEAEGELNDIALGNVLRALKSGDMDTTRWYLERRNRDYAPKKGHIQLARRKSAEEEAKDQRNDARLLKLVNEISLERAKKGLPPIFEH